MATTYTEYAEFNAVLAATGGAGNSQPRLFASGSTPKLYLSASAAGIVDLAGANSLAFAGDSGSDTGFKLDTDTLTFAGTANEITTAVADNTVTISLPDAVTIGDTLAVTGVFTANGNVDLGNATSDTVSVTGRFDTDLLPSSDSARDLGSSALQWAEVHADAGHIDALTVTGTSTLTTVDINGGAIDGTAIGASSAAAGTFAALVGTSLSVSDGSITNVNDIALDTISADDGSSFSMGSNWTNASRTVADMGTVTTMDLNGGSIDATAIGAATPSTAVFTTVSSSATIQSGGSLKVQEKLIPSADGYSDIGTSTKEFKDLYLDGVAYIDTLNADALGANLDHANFNSTNVDIDSGAIDGTIIGAASAAAATVTTLSLTEMGANWTNASRTVADMGSVTTMDLNGGTIDGTDVTVGSGKTLDVSGGTLTTSAAQKLAVMQGAGANVDIGAYNLRAASVTADGQTSGRVAIYSTAGLLSEDSDLTFSDATLTMTSGSFAHMSGSGALKVGGVTIVAKTIKPDIDNNVDLGASGMEFKDLYLDGVAYVDTLNADALGANLDHANFNSTNVDIDSGAIDGTVIGANSAAAGTFAAVVATSLSVSDGSITNVNDIALDTISADDGSSFAMGSNWTNAGRTVADAGILTTVDINGGSIDGATLGGASAVTITNADMNGGSVDGVAIGAASPSTGVFTTLTCNSSFLPDAAGGADLGSVSAEWGDLFIADDKKIQLGNGQDFTIEYDEDGDDVAQFAGSNMRLGHGAATELQFRDAALKVYSSADGQLDLAADAELEVTAPILDLNCSTSVRVSTKMCIGGDDASFGSNELLVLPSTGKIKAAAYVTYSDESLKTNIETLDSALETIKSLRGVSYEVKETGNNEIGLIAQEVNEIVPSVVQSESEVMGIDYSRLTAVLIEAVKELAAKVENTK